MKYASALVLERLNDEAVRRQYNEALTDEFLDRIDRAVPAVCFVAFAHGVRPHSALSPEARPRIIDTEGKDLLVEATHLRTAWRTRLEDGSTEFVLLDIPAEAFALLPDVPEPFDEFIIDPIKATGAAHPIVVMEGEDGRHWPVDGVHVLEAMKQLDKEGKTDRVPTIGAPVFPCPPTAVLDAAEEAAAEAMAAAPGADHEAAMAPVIQRLYEFQQLPRWMRRRWK